MAEQHGKTLVPQIRFAGFTDPWEQRKLGELSSEFKSGEFICADNVSESGSYPVYGGNGLRGYTTTFNHEGLYTLIGRQGALCGNVNIADGKSYFTEHAVAVKANHLNNTTFLYYLFGTLDLGQYSGQSAQPGLAVSNLVEVEAMVPDKAEQKKISRVFKTVDSLITLHQRKYDKLCVLKKSMLDKMFPKGGSLYPEIRFAGFTDPWEQRKLGELEKQDVLHLKRGIVISAADMESCPGNYPVYSSSASQNGEMGKYGKYMFNQELVTWSIDGGGSVFYRPKHKFSVTNVCGYVETSSMVDCAFLAYQMGYIHSQIHFDYTVKAHPSVIRDLYTLSWTSLTEQRRIGAFFDRLDSLITLHQRKYCGVASWMLGVALVRLGSESDGAFGEMKHVLR